MHSAFLVWSEPGTSTSPRIELLLEDDDRFHATNRTVLRNTMLGSFLDLPGMALPNGVDRQGLPTSVLLSGSPGTDDRVLAAAPAVERALDDAGLWVPLTFPGARQHIT